MSIFLYFRLVSNTQYIWKTLTVNLHVYKNFPPVKSNPRENCSARKNKKAQEELKRITGSHNGRFDGCSRPIGMKRFDICSHTRGVGASHGGSA